MYQLKRSGPETNHITVLVTYPGLNHKTKVNASFKCRVLNVGVYFASFETWLQVCNIYAAGNE